MDILLPDFGSMLLGLKASLQVTFGGATSPVPKLGPLEGRQHQDSMPV
jgi:hypothetical protein